MTYEIIQIKHNELRQLLAKLVEDYLVWYIKRNRRALVEEAFPGLSVGRVDFMTPTPRLRGKPLGYHKKRAHRPKIRGWHGDLVVRVNSKESGKHAIIYEIKTGNISISRSQHEFFKAVVADPGKYMRKLQGVAVYIAHCTALDLEKRELTVEIRRYNEVH